MPNRFDRPSTDPVAAALRDLSAHLEITEPPDIAARVRARIEREAATVPVHVGTGSRRFRVAAAAFAAVALVVSVAAIPRARHAVADLFGIGGERVEFRQPGVTVTTARPDTLRLGPVVSLDRARMTLPDLLVPNDAALGSPDRVVADATRPEVSFVYTGTDGRITTLVSEWRADAGPFFEKMLGNNSAVEAVTVNGSPGAWISGRDHFFFYTDASGHFVEEQGRLAGSALIWQQGPITLRIEGELTRARALEIAASLR